MYTMYDMYSGIVPMGNDSDGIFFNSCTYFQQKQWILWLYFLSSLLFVFLSYISNGLVIFIITVEKTLRTPTFYALRSLSVVSVLYITLVFITSPVTCFFDDPFNLIGKCGWDIHVRICLRQITLVHLSLIAAIRVYLIALPLHSMVHLTVTKVRYVSLAIWIIFIFIEVLFYIFKVRSCSNFSLKVTTSEIYYIIELILVLVSVIIFYLAANIIMRCKSQQSRALRTAVQKRQTRATSLTLVGMITVFSPIQIINVIIVCDSGIQEVIRIVGVAVEFLFFGVNPFILVLGLKHIRTNIKQRLSCFLKVKHWTKRNDQSISKTMESRLSATRQSVEGKR